MRIIISPAKRCTWIPTALRRRACRSFCPRRGGCCPRCAPCRGRPCKPFGTATTPSQPLNMERLRHMDLERDLTPAILSYEGIQYQYGAGGF